MQHQQLVGVWPCSSLHPPPPNHLSRYGDRPPYLRLLGHHERAQDRLNRGSAGSSRGNVPSSSRSSRQPLNRGNGDSGPVKRVVVSLSARSENQMGSKGVSEDSGVTCASFGRRARDGTIVHHTFSGGGLMSRCGISALDWAFSGGLMRTRIAARCPAAV